MLNALEEFSHFFPAGSTKIWYYKDPRSVATVATLRETHVCLGGISLTDVEKIYMALQGEAWSPNGEARAFLGSLGLHHTSMSTGDVIEIDGKFFVCMVVNFKEIT